MQPRALFACSAMLAKVTANGKEELGKKGIAVCALPPPNSSANSNNNNQQLSHYGIVTFDSSTRAELCIYIDAFFMVELDPVEPRAFLLQDSTQQQYTITCMQQDEMENFMRFMVLARDALQAKHAASGGTRSILWQDLSLGVSSSTLADNSPTLAIGDAVKLKYSVYQTSDTHPFGGVGKKIMSVGTGDHPEPVKLVLGANSGFVLPAIEQAVLGIRKRGRRFVVVPPHLWSTDTVVFGPLVAPESSLCIDITVVQVKYARERTDSASEVSVPPTATLASSTSVSTPPSASHVNNSTSSSSARTSSSSPTNSASVNELTDLFIQLDMQEYIPSFLEEQIFVQDLPLLSEEELSRLVTKLGPRKRLLQAVRAPAAALSSPVSVSMSSSPSPSPSASSTQSTTAVSPPSDPSPVPPLNSQSSASRLRVGSSPTPFSTASAAVQIKNAHAALKPVSASSASSSASIETESSSPSSSESSSSGLSALASIPRDKAMAYAKQQYEKGKEETADAARQKIRQIQETATNRIQELEQQLAQLNEGKQTHTATLQEAKSIISDLKAKLRAAEAEKEELVAKSKDYVGRMRTASQEMVTGGVKRVLDALYSEMEKDITSDSIYDGKDVLIHLRNKIKSVAQSYLSK